MKGSGKAQNHGNMDMVYPYIVGLVKCLQIFALSGFEGVNLTSPLLTHPLNHKGCTLLTPYGIANNYNEKGSRSMKSSRLLFSNFISILQEEKPFKFHS
jgi:hypothetical protein